MKPNLSIVREGTNDTPTLRPVDPNVVANLASALNVAFQIKPGRDLVMAIGAGHETSNIEALETWVRTSLERHGLTATRQGLSILICELEKQLAIWELDQGE